MNWKLRFLISTIYRNMPFYRHFRSILRKYRRPKWIFATHDWALIHAIKQIEMLKSVNFDVTYKNILEIGTGWSPISPIIYSLVGAKSITTVDIDYCLSEDSFFVAVDGIANPLG